MATKVLIVDDEPLARERLVRMLGALPDTQVVGQASNGQEALTMAREGTPDVVLMDVRMPGVDGIAATAAIVTQTGARVLMLTSFDVDDHVLGGLRAGASGYLLKTVEAADLIAAVRTVHGGGAVLGPEVTATVVAAAAAAPPPLPDPVGSAGLTERERQVHALLAEGRSNRQIARRLGIGENTVKTHVARVLRKLGLSSRAEVAAGARGGCASGPEPGPHR